jgi:phosphogluconate dehydratase
VDGDVVRLDATRGTLEVIGVNLDARVAVEVDLTANGFGIGRELFDVFRATVGPATEGARVV